MCGIAGMFDFDGGISNISGERLTDMSDALKRRGPNQQGIWKDEHAAFVHTRLSVIDLEHGLQPMTIRRGEEEYILIYNGELYNTNEIKSELKSLGHDFTEQSDTEVLFHAYIQWGEDCLSRLNGIFAFAVYEKHKRRIFLARDRIGVKPLFYSMQNGLLIFASEIKAILKSGVIQPRINTESIAEIMLIGPGRTPGVGIFCGINEIKPGHFAYVGETGIKIHKYWELKAFEHSDSLERTVEKVRFLVVDSIKRQLVSDVPIATFLSGGLDSSIISSVAAAVIGENGGQLNTFSVDYNENEKYFTASRYQPGDDRHYIRIMNRFLGAKGHSVVLDTDELAAGLYDAVRARDLPGMADVDSSLMLFCGRIKEYATVALSGECADETEHTCLQI